METTPAIQVPPRRWRRRLLITLKVLAAVAIFLLVAHTVCNLIAGVKLNRTLARLQAEGLPTRVEDIVPAPVPPDKNGAVPLRAAFGLIGDDPSGKTGTAALVAEVEKWYTSLPPPEKPKPAPTPANIAAMREKLSSPELTLVYEKVCQAAACDTANFDLDYTKGPGLLLPHLSKVRTLARLLAARAWLRADQGDAVGALADIRGVVRLGRLFEKEPILISQLVRIAVQTIAATPLQHLLDPSRPDPLPPDAVAALVQDLRAARVANQAAMVPCADGERVAFGGIIFDEWLGRRPAKITREMSPDMIGELVSDRGLRAYVSYPFRPLLKLDYREYLDIMIDWRHDLEKSYWQLGLQPGVAPALRLVPRWCLLTRILVPALQRIPAKVAQNDANLLLAEVALALDQYRHTKGQYPADLKELGLAEAPMDPFTGKDLLYRRTESGGAVVYSVGPNGVDDGGKVGPKPGTPLDIAWQLKP